MAKTLGAKARWGGRGRKFKSCHSDQTFSSLCTKNDAKRRAYSRRNALYLVFFDVYRLVFFCFLFRELQKKLQKGVY